jgi:hypothetical protein
VALPAAAAGMALEFIGTHKLPHPATKCFRQGGDTTEGIDFVSFLKYLKTCSIVVIVLTIRPQVQASKLLNGNAIVTNNRSLT